MERIGTDGRKLARFALAFIWRSALLASLLLIVSTSHDAQAANPLITAACFQAAGSSYQGGISVPNGGQMAVAKGDSVAIRLQYHHGDDSTAAYP